MLAKLATCLAFLLLLISSTFAENNEEQGPYQTLYVEWKSEVDSLDNYSPPLSSQKRADEKREINREFGRRFLELARAHPDDDVWLKCVIWMVAEEFAGDDFDAMIDVMHENAAGVSNTIQLQLLMSEFIPLDSDRLNPALMSIAETHPSQGVRGTSLYALAARTKRLAEEDGDLPACREAERLLERVIAEYPTARSYRGENAKNAKAMLDELRGPLAIGKTAPEILGSTITGSEFKLSNLEGQVVVLSFSGHWCGPCCKMHPVLKSLLNEYTSSQLYIVEINSDTADDLDSVSQTMDEQSLKWEVVTDGPDGPIAKQWRVTSWPTFFVLDPNLRIRRSAHGDIGDKLSQWVDELVQQR